MQNREDWKTGKMEVVARQTSKLFERRNLENVVKTEVKILKLWKFDQNWS